MTSTRIRLRVQHCQGGDECPALDRTEPGWIEVTGQVVDRPGLPPGEGTVKVPDTLLPEIAALEVVWRDFIDEHFRTDFLRIQTLDYYGMVASDRDHPQRYLAGEPMPEEMRDPPWLETLRTDTAAGKIRRNLHVVRAPLNDYLRFQFEWGYVRNAAAGMDIRVLDVSAVPAAARLFDVGDFGVIEGVHVARLIYSMDRPHPAAVAIGSDASAGYAALAELAWGLGTPFPEWWDAHPQYRRENHLTT
jgi:hypothetical protein